jgi:hypothetical protein
MAAGLDIFLTFFDLLFGIVIIFVTLIIFIPFNKYKKLKVKEDQLFLQKTLITNIFFCLFIIFNIIGFFSKDIKNYIYIASNYLFNIFVIVILLYNLMMSLEIYNTFKNPVHYFNRLFKQNKYNYIQEFIIIICSIIILIVDLSISYMNEDLLNDNSDDISICYVFLINYWKPIAIVVLVIISVVYYCKMKSLISNFISITRKNYLMR